MPEKEELKFLEWRERLETAAENIIEYAKKLGFYEGIGEKGSLHYEATKRKLMIILGGRPIEGYSEFDLSLRSGILGQHNYPYSTDYSVKGIPMCSVKAREDLIKKLRERPV